MAPGVAPAVVAVPSLPEELGSDLGVDSHAWSVGRHVGGAKAPQAGSSPFNVTRWMTRCWEPKSPTTECWVDRLSQKPTSPSLQR